MSKSYNVVHPVRHDGKPYNRGEQIPVGTFSEKEAMRLLAAGVITEGGGTIVVQVPAFTAEDLAILTIPQLTEYALSKFKLTLKAGLKKEEILSEINQAVQSGAAVAEAEALAAAQGR